jgi:hypothetical protein
MGSSVDLSVTPRRRTSLHLKHNQFKGPVLPLGSALAAACRQAVLDSRTNKLLAGGYVLA